jgi:hypothetical protein
LLARLRGKSSFEYADIRSFREVASPDATPVTSALQSFSALTKTWERKVRRFAE